MGGLLGGGQTVKPIEYSKLQLQSAIVGLPIPIMWGTTRISPNIVDLYNFQKLDTGKNGQPGGKGLGKSGEYDYTATVILALCEGPQGPITNAWQNGTPTTANALGFTYFSGTQTQLPWSYTTDNDPSHALSYAQTAYVANSDYDLGSSATLPDNSFEIMGRYHGQDVGSTYTDDANIANIVYDFLTNPQYALAMSPDLLNMADLATLRNYTQAQGLYYSPLLTDTEQVITTLDRWATIGNYWNFWSGNQLRFVVLGDTQITANGTTFYPNNQPIYNLGLDDFVSDSKEPPVVVTRIDPADGYNVVQLDIRERGNAYNNTSVRYMDQSSIDTYGELASNVVSASEICDIVVGQTACNLIGKRSVYIRNTYEFTTSYRYVLLEPGDIVTLTEPNIGLSLVPVRIREVQEDDKDQLKFIAEECPSGLGYAALYTPDGYLGSGQLYNNLVAPGNTNPPSFLQAPSELTNGDTQLWIGLSGGQWWGSCGVYMSVDSGASYQYLGTQTGASVQGTLTAALALESGLDTTHTIAVDCTESLGVIAATATESSAALYQTLCLIDEELIAFGSADPTGANTFDLTYLYRGVYGTEPAAHASGAQFCLVGPSTMFRTSAPVQYYGESPLFKFPATNLFGNSGQSLSDCTPYTFSLVAPTPPAPVAEVSYGYLGNSLGAVVQDATITAPLPTTNPGPANAAIRWSKYPAGTSGQVYGTTTCTAAELAAGVELTSTQLTGSGDGYSYLSARWLDSSNNPLSAWSSDVGQTTVPPPTSVTAVNQFDSTYKFTGVLVSWTAPAGATPESYIVYGALDTEIYATAPGPATSVLITATAIGVSTPVCLQALYTGGLNSQTTALATPTGGTFTPALLTSNVSATGGPESITVTWLPLGSSPQPSYFLVYYWDNAYHTICPGIMTVSVPNPTVNDGGVLGTVLYGLTSGHTYSVVVVTYNSAGTSESFNACGEPTISQLVTATAT